jgi:hypothetical protein
MDISNIDVSYANINNFSSNKINVLNSLTVDSLNTSDNTTININNELKKVVSIQNLNDIQQESLLTIKLDQRLSSSKDEYNNVKMHSLNKNNSNGKSDPNI